MVTLLASLAACTRSTPELVARPVARPPAILIHDVAVLDVESGIRAPGRDVVLVGDRIRAIGAVGQLEIPPGAYAISGERRTLLPGLVDMHGHVGNSSAPPWISRFPDPEANLRAYLYCGVTTVLDPADLSTQAFTRRDAVRRGELLGPAIYAAGPMLTSPGGHPLPVIDHLAPWWIRWYLRPRFAIELATPDDARAAVDRVVDMGADVIKLAVDRVPEESPRIGRDVLDAAVAEARRRGIRAVAHVGTVEDALDAARAGIAAWMHGVYKERIPDDRIRDFAGFRIPMVATMAVFESYALTGQGPRVPTPLEIETVPGPVLAGFDHPPAGDAGLRFFAPFFAKLRAERQSWRDNVRRLRAAGVTILAGSDTQIGMFPGAGLHRELHLLTEAGLTPADAIRAATIDGARFLVDGREPDFGSVAVGKRADLLLVEGDPTRDLDALARIRAVILGGVVLERRPVAAPPAS